jgi:hypothetical protein
MHNTHAFERWPMELRESLNKVLQAFILFILPLLLLVVGLVLVIENVWYYVIFITWFGSGVVFFNAIN